MSDSNKNAIYATYTANNPWNKFFDNSQVVKIDDTKTILEDLKKSIDELTRYLKPYHGNLLVGKAAVDEYESLLKRDRK